MYEKLEEVKETLEDIKSLENTDNSLMMSASTYIDHVGYLLNLLANTEENDFKFIEDTLTKYNYLLAEKIKR